MSIRIEFPIKDTSVNGRRYLYEIATTQSNTSNFNLDLLGLGLCFPPQKNWSRKAIKEFAVWSEKRVRIPNGKCDSKRQL